MKSCFGYIRVSTVKQGDGVSLEAQKDAIAAFATAHDIEITRWFEEIVTAAKSGRPLFNQMVSELKRGKAAGVVFHKIDRSARNIADWARIGDLHEAGVEIHFAHESVDLNSRGGRLAADIQAVVAADFIRNNRAETIKGINGRLKQGLYPFKAPLGYLDTGKGKVKAIDPVRAPLVRTMFELYASGEYSLLTLIPEMERRGLTSAKGKPVSKTGIEKMLRNPFYIGLMKTRSGAIYQGRHDPLITVGLFERATSVRLGRDNKKSTKHDHLYRGLFKCGVCRGGMIPELQKGHVYYRCRTKGCVTKTIREERIEAGATSFLGTIALSDEQIGRVHARLKDWIESDGGAHLIEHARLEIGRIKDRLSKLTDKFIDDLIDEALFNEKKQALLQEETKWRQIIDNQRETGRRLDRLKEFCELAKRLSFGLQSVEVRQRRALLRFASANRFVHGKDAYFEPSKWVEQAHYVLNSTNCAHSTDAYRTQVRELSDFLETLEKREPNDPMTES